MLAGLTRPRANSALLFCLAFCLSQPTAAQTLEQLQAKLKETQSQAQQQIGDLKKQTIDTCTRYKNARRDLANAKNRLNAKTRQNNPAGDVSDMFSKLFGTERGETLTKLEKAVSDTQKLADTLKGQCKEYQSALKATQIRFRDQIARIHNDIVVTDPRTRNQEEQRRIDEAEELNTRYFTAMAQIETAKAAFKDQLKALKITYDKLIEQGEQEAADYFVETRVKDLKDTRDDFLRTARNAASAKRQDLKDAYARNKRDGLGPTSYDETTDVLRDRAKSNNEDPQDAVDFTKDDALERTKSSTKAVAEAASDSVKFSSIFYDFNAESLGTLSEGVVQTTIDYYKDPSLGFSRLGAYYEGVYEGTVDGVKDIAGLAVALADTGAQNTQGAINYWFDTDYNLFGEDKRDLVITITALAYNATQSDEGLETLAEKTENTVGAIVNAGVNALDDMAAKGDVEGALKATGYGTATILGAEEAVFSLSYKALANIGKLNNFADTISDAIRLGDKAENVTDASKLDEAAKVDDLAKTQELAFDQNRLLNKELENLYDTVKTPGAKPNPKTIYKDPQDLGLAEVGDLGGQVYIDFADGTFVTLTPKDKLGAGSTSTAYVARDKFGNIIDGFVVKFTESGTAAKFDEMGENLIKQLDPSGELVVVPDTRATFKITEGELLDSAGDVERTLKGGTGRLIKNAKDIGLDATLTGAQKKALIKFLNKANDNGLVLLDIKKNNFGFKLNDKGELVVVVVDAGGFIPIVGRNADIARQFQEDVLGFTFPPGIDQAKREALLAEFAKKLSQKYDQHIDKKTIEQAVGQAGSNVTLDPDKPGAINFYPRLGNSERDFLGDLQKSRQKPGFEAPTDVTPAPGVTFDTDFGKSPEPKTPKADAGATTSTGDSNGRSVTGYLGGRALRGVAGATDSGLIEFTIEQSTTITGLDPFNQQQVRTEFSDELPTGGIPGQATPQQPGNSSNSSNSDESSGGSDSSAGNDSGSSSGSGSGSDSGDSSGEGSGGGGSAPSNFLVNCNGDNITTSGGNIAAVFFATDENGGNCESFINTGGGESSLPLVLTVFARGGLKGDHNLSFSGGFNTFTVSPAAPSISSGFISFQQTFVITMDFFSIPGVLGRITVDVRLTEGDSVNDTLSVTVLSTEVFNQ